MRFESWRLRFEIWSRRLARIISRTNSGGSCARPDRGSISRYLSCLLSRFYCLLARMQQVHGKECWVLVHSMIDAAFIRINIIRIVPVATNTPWRHVSESSMLLGLRSCYLITYWAAGMKTHHHLDSNQPSRAYVVNLKWPNLLLRAWACNGEWHFSLSKIFGFSILGFLLVKMLCIFEFYEY